VVAGDESPRYGRDPITDTELLTSTLGIGRQMIGRNAAVAHFRRTGRWPRLPNLHRAQVLSEAPGDAPRGPGSFGRRRTSHARRPGGSVSLCGFCWWLLRGQERGPKRRGYPLITASPISRAGSCCATKWPLTRKSVGSPSTTCEGAIWYQTSW
jgi:hypothetical protein